MPTELLTTVLSNVWVVFLAVLLFGGSIFVHELGHFLAARRRGVYVERFSIGFGPAIWSWRGRDGVEYRLSWIPLGGYVLLPQLADLGAIEGRSNVDVERSGHRERVVSRNPRGDGQPDAIELPPVTYSTKMLVFVAGAAFNILFAFLLACVVWIIGQPVATSLSSTTVAEVVPTIKTADGQEVVSPAVKAGLKTGDVITAVDGEKVDTFDDIVEHLALSSGWRDGERQTIFTVRRDGQAIDIPIQPVISGSEKIRKVGFTTVAKLIVGRVTAGSPADKAGIKVDDQIVAIDGKPTLTLSHLIEGIRAPGDAAVKMSVLRSATTQEVSFARPPAGEGLDLGIALKSGFTFAHPSPLAQVSDAAVKTFRTLGALVNPRSDIGLRHMSGPIGIISNFVDVSRAGLPFALWFTILVNVNLAILNLLPVPVLDGGQMLFATISKLRGRALPTNFIMAAQSVFFVLILAMVGYISFFVDIPRINRERAAERAAEAPAQAAQPAEATETKAEKRPDSP